MALVRLSHAGRTYRMNGAAVDALRDVSLEIDPGAFIAVVGPSGSGKSTLLHLMGGVDLPTAGEVVLFGRRTDRLAERTLAALRLHHIGFVFQRFFLLPMLTVEENVILPMLEAGADRPTRAARAVELLAYVGLLPRRRHLPGQLSGGEMQRVAIARALANRPQLLLADEPTGELDQGTGRAIGRLLVSVNEQGIAVVVVTHNPELAALASVVRTMRNGMLA